MTTSVPLADNRNIMSDKYVVVIGAGAGGLMAAGRAAETGARVVLLEKMDQPGKKILISGKSRCNVKKIRTGARRQRPLPGT